MMITNSAELAAFKSARAKNALPIDIAIHEHRLNALPSTVSFDLIVSPANSYGCMDGGFDHALSRAFSPVGNYLALTRYVQGVLYNEYRGFAPPGTCTIVDLSASPELLQGLWGCRYLAVSPTMRVPQDVVWDREVVYECIWTLLNSIRRHNDNVSEGGRRIESIMTTPLATLTGRWSPERWAEQFMLAVRHFLEACERPEERRHLDPRSISDIGMDIAATHAL
jgi:O-acetyl-ADP-ribose deacetylase (regulator of RNase III)